jgi:endo-1,4-beta-xylanase
MVYEFARRRFAILLVFSILGLTSRDQTLREEAACSSRFIGAAARSSQLTEDHYAASLAREFNMLEPEDELKWEVIHPAPTIFDFLPADRLVVFARMHHMKVRGHTLVWQRHLPAWLEQGTFSAAQLNRLLKVHIDAVVGHYRGQIFAWDVVNEAFDENGQLRSTIWSNNPGIGVGPGTAFIETALRWTHSADPEALLFLNEAECETVNRKSDAIYELVHDLKPAVFP